MFDTNPAAAAAAAVEGLEALFPFVKEDWLGGAALLAGAFALLLVPPQIRPRVELALVAGLGLHHLGALYTSLAFSSLAALLFGLFLHVHEERARRQAKELTMGACLTLCGAVLFVGSHCFALSPMTAVLGGWVGVCVCLLDYAVNAGRSPVPVMGVFAVGFSLIAYGFADAVVAAWCCGLPALVLGMLAFLVARHRGNDLNVLGLTFLGMAFSAALFVAYIYFTLWFVAALCAWTVLLAFLLGYVDENHKQRGNVKMLVVGAGLLAVGTAWLLLSYYFGVPLMAVAALCSWMGFWFCWLDYADRLFVVLAFPLGWLGIGYLFTCTFFTAVFGGMWLAALGASWYVNDHRGRRSMKVFGWGATLSVFGTAWFLVLYYFDWPLRMVAALCGFMGACICLKDHVEHEDPGSRPALLLLPLGGVLIAYGFGNLVATLACLSLLTLTGAVFAYLRSRRNRVAFDRLEAGIILTLFSAAWLLVSYLFEVPPTVALSGGLGACVCLFDYAERNPRGFRLVFVLAPLGLAAAAHWLGFTFIAAAWFCSTVVGISLPSFLEANPQYTPLALLGFVAELACSLVYVLYTLELLASSTQMVGAGGLLVGGLGLLQAGTRFHLYVARVVGAGLLHSLGWLLPALAICGLGLLVAATALCFKRAPLVPGYNCATLLPFNIPIYHESKVANEEDFHTLLQFRALLNQLETTLAGRRELADSFDRKVARQMGGRNVDQVMRDIAVSQDSLLGCIEQLGVDKFTALPTAAQKEQIEKRDESRRNLNEWVRALGDLISLENATELRMLNQALEEQLERLDALTRDAPDRFVSPSTPSCAESAKRLQIEQTVAEILRSSTIAQADAHYARIASLCKMNTQRELDELKNQVRNAIFAPNPFPPMLSALDRLVSAEFLVESLDAQSALDRGREVLRLVLELKAQHQENLRRIAYKEEILLRLNPEDERRGEFLTSIKELMEANRELKSERDRRDDEMKRLFASVSFPEMFHVVPLEWENTAPLVEAAEDLRLLLEQLDLLNVLDVSGFGQATARMRRTLAGNARLRGHTSEGVEVVLKTLRRDDGSMVEMRRMFQLCRVAQHPLLLPCLSGSLTANGQELQLVLPYMPGGDYAFWCGERNRPLSRKTDVLTQVCDALRVLFQMGACHGKLDPSNIVMTSAGDDAVPKLINMMVGTELAGNRTEFCAPEAAAALGGSAEKRDVFSFGALVRWSGAMPTDPALRQLVQSCLNPSPQNRPRLRDVHQAFSARTCIICLNDDKPFKDCVVCPDGAHSMCKPCFDAWVVDRLTTELGQRKEGIACCNCNNDHYFPMHLYAAHMGLVLRSQRESTEATIHQRIQEELRKKQAEEALLSGVDLAVRRAHDLLTGKCPACTAAFYDFAGCCSLTCAQCNIQFCAFCHQGAAVDAHPHVANCRENPTRGQLFCSDEAYAAQQTAFKRRRLQDFLATLEVTTQNQVRARLREHL